MLALSNLLPCAYYAPVVICLLFAIRCFTLMRTLKEEYQIQVSKMDLMQLSLLEKSIELTELKFLLHRFIRASAWLNVSAILSAFSLFVCVVAQVK